MDDKLIENIKYFKHLCDKENLLYEEVDSYTIPFNGVRYSVNRKYNEIAFANIVIDEIMNKPSIYRLIQVTLETLNNIK